MDIVWTGVCAYSYTSPCILRATTEPCRFIFVQFGTKNGSSQIIQTCYRSTSDHFRLVGYKLEPGQKLSELGRETVGNGRNQVRGDLSRDKTMIAKFVAMFT